MSADELNIQQYKKMTETPIPKLILGLAAPTILSMLITSIYNLADTFFVGQISTSASGAVGIVSSLMAIIQALGFTLGHGSGTIISRSLGSRNTDAATRFASTSFFTALAVGVVLAVVGLATLPSFMMLLGSTETILPHACAYARPILIAAPLYVRLGPWHRRCRHCYGSQPKHQLLYPAVHVPAGQNRQSVPYYCRHP